MNKTWTIVKVLLLIVLIFLGNGLLAYVEPIYMNNLAMQQMGNDDLSSSWISIYTYFRNGIWLAYVFAALAFFHKEIAYITKKLTKKDQRSFEEKENKNHEEHASK